MSHHNRTRQPSEDDEEDDPLDRILKKSGCADLHYKVQVNDLFSFVYQELLHLVFFHMMEATYGFFRFPRHLDHTFSITQL